MSKAKPGWREEKRLAREAAMKRASKAAVEVETEKKHRLWPLGVILAIVLLGASVALVADYKSTFLINGGEYSSLSWLAPDYSEEKWSMEVLKRVINNGDTHMDIYTRSTDRGFGHLDGVDTKHWRSRLNMLRDRNISPVIWLTSDDRKFEDNTIAKQVEYNNQVVDAIDDLVSHYVVCLECDESFSPQGVSVMIQNLRRKGVNKPIGVHLTPHLYKSQNRERLAAYYKDADVIYLQTGWAKEIGEEEFRRRIEYALTFGKPVVVSEYDREGTTSTARAFGNIACSYEGVVGTGNGRGNTVCGSLQREVEEPKKSWEDKQVDRARKEFRRWERFVKKNDQELSFFAGALVAWSVTYGRELPFMIRFNWATEDGYEVMYARELTPNTQAGVTVRDNGRVMAFISGIFGGKNEKSSNHNQEAARR